MKAGNSFGFQKQLVALMQSQMFKDIKADKAQQAKKKGKAPAAAVQKAAAGIQAKVARVAVAEDKSKAKKNRKERRKDQRKDRRRDIKK